MTSNKIIYLECGCGSPAHLIRIQNITFDSPELEITIQLNHYLPWYKRLVNGVRYIFGGLDESDYHFDSTLLSASEANRLFIFLHQFRAERITYEQAKANNSNEKGS